jgi:hypothetical protein
MFLTATEAVFSLPVADSPEPVGVENDALVSAGLRIRPFDLRRTLSQPVDLSRGASDLTPAFNPQSAFHSRPARHSTVRMKFAGANPHATIEGLDRLPGITNYFIGNDPTKWRTNISHYGKVRYRDLYPGIDLVFYGNPQQLEYDLIVRPGAQPSMIQLAFEGANRIQTARNGDLVIRVAETELRQQKPRIHQNIQGKQTQAAGHYVVTGKNTVSFELASYDIARELVIDPVLLYSTYLGGVGADAGLAIAVDNQGSAYLTGYAASRSFPLKNPLQGPVDTECLNSNAAPEPCPDVFVSKLNPQGSDLVYSTYLGGKGGDTASAIAVDGQGNTFITGGTSSTDFPTTAGSLQPQAPAPGNCRRFDGGDAFIAKLNPAGNSLVYSTYVGGSCGETGRSIAVDAAGNATIAGGTTSTDFPTTPGAYNRTHRGFGLLDGFAARLNANGSSLVYSTLLGEFGVTSVAVDASGSTFIAGATAGGIPTTPGAFQRTPGGNNDAVVIKLNPSGSSLVYSTYLGGAGVDGAVGISVDSSGNAYVAGTTDSNNFPLKNSFQPVSGYGSFAAKLNSAGSDVLYSTFIPGGAAQAISVDSAGSAHITGGVIDKASFPLLYPLQPDVLAFGSFLTKLAPGGSDLAFSTFFGGHRGTQTTALALDSSGDVFLTGLTSDTNFPTLNPIQGTYGGSDTSKPWLSHSDAFVSKISGNSSSFVPAVLAVPIVLSSSGVNNSFYTTELTLTNLSSKDAALELAYTAAIGSGSGMASAILPARQQQIIPDAIVHLRQMGIPIPESGNQGGTLAIRFSYSGPFPYSDLAVTARTTTRVANGRAGLAYAAVPAWNALTRPSCLFGLRQSSTDRSNVAIQNLGLPEDGNITLRLSVVSGTPSAPQLFTLPDVQLGPGQFRQFNSVLASANPPIAQGYVRVERVSGRAPYYAYGVINDQVTSDGSFVAATPEEDPLGPRYGLTVPAIVENSNFVSEVVVANKSAAAKQLSLKYTAEAITAPAGTVTLTLSVAAGEQTIIPNFVQHLREKGATGVGPRGLNFAGPLIATAGGNDLGGIFLGARTSSPGGGGNYGLFYSAAPFPWQSLISKSVWLFGLQQNAETRTNLAIVNVPTPNEDSNVYTIELFDGATGTKVNTLEGIRVKAREWVQFNSILAQYAAGVTQGYARISRPDGSNQFVAYAVINDGGAPGERTGDGAFIASSP